MQTIKTKNELRKIKNELRKGWEARRKVLELQYELACEEGGDIDKCYATWMKAKNLTNPYT